MLLLAVAILPATGALVYVQIELRHERLTRVSEGSIHQAGLIAADVTTIIDAARQLTLAISQLEQVQALDGGCQAALTELQRVLPSYALLAVADRGGNVICASHRAGIPDLDARGVAGAGMGGGSAGLDRFRVGRYWVPGAGATPLVPMIRSFTTRDGRTGSVMAAVDLNWLESHLSRFVANPHHALNVADAAGTILMRLPDNRRWRGRSAEAASRGLIDAAQPGSTPIAGVDGVVRTVGYVPASATGGLYVSYGVYLPDLLAGIDRAAERGYLLVGIGAVLSLLLMVAITRRMVHAPTEALLGAAQRWAVGDFNVRVPADCRNEFGRLGSAFNTMAETLNQRRQQLYDLQASLEAQVGERTRALSETNNRLVVEIAERERTDAALRQSQKLQAVGHLAGGMAHEFNNLLTAVLGSLELIRRRVTVTAEQPLLRYVAAAEEAAQRGARLTSQLLAFSRRRRLMPFAVDLRTVVNDMRDLLGGTLGRKVSLQITADPDLWPALADRHEIEAAILNLALNARDAMPEGGALCIRLRNVPAGQPPAGAEPPDIDVMPATVELSVEDDGVGMDEEALAHAINPFFTTKAPGDGAGLGLSQVHGLAKQLGGDLTIRSKKGLGTVVSLRLPKATATGLSAPLRTTPSQTRRGPLLLVDDDAQVRAIAAEMLAEIGFDVAQADAGPAALALLRQRPPAAPFGVMVADYAMPGMSGVELINEARRLQPALVTLLITGYMDLSCNGDASCVDGSHVLRKPFTLRDLAERIDTLSARPAPQPALSDLAG